MSKFVTVMSLKWMCNKCQIMSESVFDCAQPESECLTEVKFYPTLNVMSKFVSAMSLEWMCNKCQIIS